MEVEIWDTVRAVPHSLIAAVKGEESEDLYTKTRKVLKERILSEGKNLGGGILKVNSFINHRVDVQLMDLCGRAMAEYFRGSGATLVMTAQTSGILPAQAAAKYLEVPLLFARENKPITMDGGVYEAKSRSRTKGSEISLFVASEYITNTDRVLVVDDFLSTGTTAVALFDIIKQAGAMCTGFAFLVEKTFEGGRTVLQEAFKSPQDYSIPIEALANVVALGDDGSIKFAD